MGAGKNAAARRLAHLYLPLRVVEVSFAAKLKQSFAALLGCEIADLERWKNHPNAYLDVRIGERIAEGQTIRSALQRYGTEAHREIFGQGFWLDAALPIPPSGATMYDDALYVVTDVRFENEAQRIRDLGGYVILIRGPNEHTGGHASEVELDNCEYRIDNRERGDGYASLDAQLSSVLARAAE